MRQGSVLVEVSAIATIFSLCYTGKRRDHPCKIDESLGMRRRWERVRRMRNKYPGICYRCGKFVKAGDGHFEKIPHSSNWRVQHADCAIAYRGTKVGIGEPKGPRGGTEQ